MTDLRAKAKVAQTLVCDCHCKSTD